MSIAKPSVNLIDGVVTVLSAVVIVAVATLAVATPVASTREG